MSHARAPSPHHPRGAAALACVLALSLAAEHGAAAQDADTPVRIRDVAVFDVVGGTVRPGLDVTVRDGLIESVEATRAEAAFDGRVIEGAGRFLIPGLIDAHVHLSGSPRERTAAVLRWGVEGGVTSVRDMAGDARDLAGIQQALLRGELEGPSLHYSALMAGPAFMSDPRLASATEGIPRGQAPFMIELTDRTDLVRAVATAKGTGATGLKLYAALDADLVAAATAEAHRVGLLVWAHSAIFPATPVEVLDAGLDGVSHAPYAEPLTPDFTLRARGDFAAHPPDGPAADRVIEAMLRNGTVLDPTLFVFDRVATDEIGRARLAWGAAFTGRAARAGVTIAAATDGFGNPVAGALPNVHDEMRLLVELARLTPAEALMAATLGGARAIGVEERVGAVAVGRVADLVLLGADPTADIGHTRRIVHVLREGRVVR